MARVKEITTVVVAEHLECLQHVLKFGMQTKLWSSERKRDLVQLRCENLLVNLPDMHYLILTQKEYNILRECICWCYKDSPAVKQLFLALGQWSDHKVKK